MSSALSTLTSVLIQPVRQFGAPGNLMIPDVVVEEDHLDTLTITQHPVEQGAAITDHAYFNPSQVTVHMAWTNSVLGNLAAGNINALGGVSGLLTGSGSGLAGVFAGIGSAESRVQLVYAQLKSLQQQRQPFTLITGKASYSNMLIASLAITTDAAREYALDVTITFQQVFIVQTQAAQIAPQADHAIPQTTAPTQDVGTTQTTTTPTPSILSQGTDWIKSLFQ